MTSYKCGVKVLTIMCALEYTYAAASCNKGPVTCDFETGLCGFQLSGHWTRTKSPYAYHFFSATQNISSAKSGVEFLVNDWHKEHVIKVDTVSSPCLESGTYTLTFWYFCTGENVGLTVKTSEGYVWSSNNRNNEKKWKMLTLTVNEQQQFKIIFQLIRSGSETVGIDDINIEMVQAETTSSLPTLQQPRSANCNFTSSDDNCGYTLGDRWVLKTGPYLYKQRAKLISSGEGDKTYAMFDFERNATNSSETAANEMTSPDIPTGTYNVSFWYIAPATKSQIELVRIDARGKETVIWTGKGERGGKWKHWHMDILVTQPVRIAFRGTISILHGRMATSIIGVDNIEITKLAPNPSATLHTTETDLTTSASRVSSRVPSKSVTSIKPPLSSAKMFTVTTGSLPQSLDPTNTSQMIFSTKVPSKQTSTISFTNSPSSQSMANESTSTVSGKVPTSTAVQNTVTQTSTTSTLGTTTRKVASYSAYTYPTTDSRISKPSTSIITFSNDLSTTVHSRTRTSINSSQDVISTSTGVPSYTHGATVDSESTALTHSTHNSASTHIPATNAASFLTTKANTPSTTGQPAQKSSPRTTSKQTTRVPLITSSKHYQGNAKSEKEKDKIKTTSIIGIVIGVIAAVLIALGVLYMYMRGKAKGVVNPVSGSIDEEEATFDHYTQRTSRELRLELMTGTL